MIDGVKVKELKVHPDERGALMVMVTPVVGIAAGCCPCAPGVARPQSSWRCWRPRDSPDAGGRREMVEWLTL